MKARLAILVVVLISSIHSLLACTNVAECSLNGACINSKCECEPAWLGPDCGTLHLLPTPTDAGLNVNRSSTWGGGVIQDSMGVYHMYAAFMENHCGLNTWTQNSVIAHAIGKSYMGPFVFQSTITAPFAHNPQPSIAPDGTYLIFHIGCSDEVPSNLKNCTNGTTPSGVAEQMKAYKGLNPYDCDNFAVRALSASSPEGPWTDHALFSPVSGQDWPKSTDNPTVYYYSNGSVIVLFRSWYVESNGTKQSWIGAATAPHWQGPYHVPSKPLFETNQEDPFIWRDKANGYFHALFHTQVSGACGRHAYSMDGISWTLSPTAAYNQSVQFEDGKSSWLARRERPQLHFDPATGRPIALYNGVQPDSNDRTYTLVTPIFSG